MWGFNLIIVKLCPSLLSDQMANNPLNFDLVGSNDCKNWSALKEVKDENWSGNDVEKSWTVSEDNLQAFYCYGIRVHKISGKNCAGIQNIRMWKKTG